MNRCWNGVDSTRLFVRNKSEIFCLMKGNVYHTVEKSCSRRKFITDKKNFDRSWTENPWTEKKKKKITDTKFHISDEAWCAENDNISWSGGQVRMNASDARVPRWTDNWKSLSHISIRRIVRRWLLPRPLSSFVRLFYWPSCLCLSPFLLLPVHTFAGEEIKLGIFGFKAFFFSLLYLLFVY